MALLGGHTEKNKNQKTTLQILILDRKTEFISVCSAD